MSPGDKYQLAFSLAKIFNTLQAFNPPLLHGHLTSHNVFLEFQSLGGTRRVSGIRLAELELAPLIKYAGTFYGYKGVSVWSAPEVLKAPKRGEVPESDVYSFGMLMWELWHETVPFDNDVALCQQYVLQEDARPMIQITGKQEEGEVNTCEEEMAKLIRLCWQTNPESRPKFGYICSLLSSLIPPQS